MRFENSICRYDEDDVIRRIFDLMGVPAAPPGKARACLEEIFKMGRIFETLTASLPHGSHMLEQQARLTTLLELLDTSPIEPTVDQIRCDRQVVRSLFVVGRQRKIGVAINAGIGAIFYCGETDLLISQVAPITGSGMEMRRDYLCSVIEVTRDTLEQTFS